MLFRISAATTLAIAVAALSGWAFDAPVFKGTVRGSVAMNPLTAVNFMLAAGALLLLGRKTAAAGVARAGRGLGAVVALIGLSKLFAYAFSIDTGLDRLLFQHLLGSNQIAPNTAGLFVLTGLALLALDFRTARGHWPAQCLALFTMLSAFVAIVGYAFGGRLLYGIPSYIPMALNTALAFFILPLGILASRPQRGVLAVVLSSGVGGQMARRLLPAAIGVPLLLGWLRSVGERTGLYDMEFGAALLIASTIVIFLFAICWTARALDWWGRKIKDNESKLRAVLNAAADAIVTIDPRGAIQEFNAAAVRMFGYQPDEVLGRNVSQLMPEPHRSAHNGYLKAYLAGGPARVVGATSEIEAIRKDGSRFPVELAVSEVQLAQGRLFTGIIRDISARKSAQAELNGAKERAEAANIAKSQFLASMSHELRTPLHGAIGMVDLLCGTQLDVRQRRFAEACRSSARSLLDLINDILDFSKIEAGKLVLESHEFELDHVVEETVRLLGPRAWEKRLELVCDIAYDACRTVRGDSVRLRQVLVNLVANAIKFTQAGEVVVRAQVESTAEECVCTRFTIADTGIGIPPERIREVFAPFTQVDNSTSRRFGGTGLGLPISQSLVQAMGGRIEVESRVGGGSTFSFRIPFATAPRSDARRMLPSDLRRLHVFVATRNEALAASLQTALCSWGMTAEVGSTGQAAWQRLRASAAIGKPFDLLIADADLQTAGGGLGQVARSDGALSGTRILLLTTGEPSAEGSPPSEQRLIKPICRSELLNAIVDCYCQPAAGTPPPEPAQEPAWASLHGGRAPRVLLAEDNQINRLYAEELLRSGGVTCESVTDGAAAVEAARRGDYDLVLMDCQMPAMDGFEATRRIRRLEQDGAMRGHLPIVALTANAVKGDRQRCLEAGMDEYVSKPFEPAAFMATVTRLLGEAASPADDAGAPRAAGEAAAPIDSVSLLQHCLGNAAFAASLLVELERTGMDRVDEIARQAAAGNAVGAAEAAHSLKGAAGIIAAGPLMSAAARIEAAGKAADLHDVIGLLETLRQEMQRCLAFAPEVRRRQSRPGNESCVAKV